jgi:hypothetical protein
LQSDQTDAAIGRVIIFSLSTLVVFFDVLAIGALLPVHDNQAKASRKYNNQQKQRDLLYGRRHQKKTPVPWMMVTTFLFGRE